jgi:deoxyribonuclease V
MRIRRLHGWDATPREAVALQSELRGRLTARPLRRSVRLVAGADAAYDARSRRAAGAVCVLRLPGLVVVEERCALVDAPFPYIPGLLTFREAPALLECFARLKTVPDAVLFDGQGILHPRRMGIAAHLGLFLALPTVGCAKSRLYGIPEEPGPAAGAWAPVRGRDGEILGACLRTRAGVKPVFVSAGHRVDLASAVALVLACHSGYRIPEPLRRAHRLAESTLRTRDERLKSPGRRPAPRRRA